ncbi:MAG: ABC transporter permease [Chthoniobacterales bacterium]
MHSETYLVFPGARIATIAGNTFIGLTRRKVFYVVLLFALLLIGGSVFMARLTFQQEFQVVKDLALGAMSLFTSLLAVLATAGLLPQDAEDRTIYTILAKPVSRLEYLAGKLLGVVGLLAVSLVVMSALFLVVLACREQTVLRETAAQMSSAPADQRDDALRLVHNAGFNLNLLTAIVLIYVKSCVLAALTLVVSTFASSTIFTTVTMAFVYFIGHLQAIAREYWLQTNSAGWLTKTFLALVALLFPDLQTFNLIDDVVAGSFIPGALLVKAVGLGMLYCVFYLALSLALFFRKEL